MYFIQTAVVALLAVTVAANPLMSRTDPWGDYKNCRDYRDKHDDDKECKRPEKWEDDWHNKPVTERYKPEYKEEYYDCKKEWDDGYGKWQDDKKKYYPEKKDQYDHEQKYYDEEKKKWDYNEEKWKQPEPKKDWNPDEDDWVVFKEAVTIKCIGSIVWYKDYKPSY